MRLDVLLAVLQAAICRHAFGYRIPKDAPVGESHDYRKYPRVCILCGAEFPPEVTS